MSTGKRIIGAIALTVSAGVVLAMPAEAGSASFGSKSCSQGSLYTRATGAQSVRHEHVRNGVYYRKTFENGASPNSNTYYPGINTESSASIQNGSASLTNATRNCAD